MLGLFRHKALAPQQQLSTLYKPVYRLDYVLHSLAYYVERRGEGDAEPYQSYQIDCRIAPLEGYVSEYWDARLSDITTKVEQRVSMLDEALRLSWPSLLDSAASVRFGGPSADDLHAFYNLAAAHVTALLRGTRYALIGPSPDY